MLTGLGLTDQDDAVYRAMLERPGLGVAALAEHLQASEESVRAALDRLADLALVRPSGQGLRAIRPKVGLTALLAQAEAEIAERQRQIEATRATIAGIAAAYDDSDQYELATRLDGLDAVRERLTELARTTRFECLSFTTGAAQTPDTMEAEKPLNQVALESGVEMRNVYQESFRNDPGTLAHARWMASLGSRSRTVATLPMRLVIIDREIAIVPIDPSDGAVGALELRSPGVVAGLVALFEQVWHSGTPFGDVPPVDANGLLPQERDLLRLLAAGHTDESAARKLAISLRGVQRLMTTLTTRLGSASRFQAGVEAARRGWV
ncbi:LuxR family transcriptional regulator [Hamadaea sp. NPDC051192]|uniref:LuxR family transcriptional regulator n=1 Tax=Hamadaea sp. NPDC051192 TaxID=3154940 RepID=UPI003414B9EA